MQTAYILPHNLKSATRLKGATVYVVYAACAQPSPIVINYS